MPLDLLDGLRQRGVQPREVHHAPLVMAELAAARPGYDVLVIVDPDSLPEADSLVAAVRRYFPNVKPWRYARHEAVRLARWNGRPATEAATQTESGAMARAQNERPRHSATVQQSPPESRPPASESETEADADGLLTQEELAMLLGLGEEEASQEAERD
jgi:hypothetical protein